MSKEVVSSWQALKMETKLDLLENKVESQTALINKLTTIVAEQNELLEAIAGQRLAKRGNSSILSKEEETTAVPLTLTSPRLTPSETQQNSSLFLHPLNLTSEDDVGGSNDSIAVDHSDDGACWFYVQRNSGYSRQGTAIPFEEEVANVGGAMDLTSGVFTAPKNGSYFFSFSAVAGIDATTVYLDVSGNVKDRASASNLQILSLRTSIMNLKEGDRVKLRLSTAAGRGSIKEFDQNTGRFTHFTGILLNDKVPSTLFHARTTRSLFDEILFDTELMNFGGGMNAETGVFTVPKDGKYFFKFNATSSDNSRTTTVDLRLNEIRIASQSVEGLKENIQLKITKELKMGDQISLLMTRSGRISDGNSNSDFIGMSLDHLEAGYDDDISRIEQVSNYFLQDYPTLISFFSFSSRNIISFYVTRSSIFSPDYRSNIPFEVEVQNRGNAMNITTGIFTAPHPGDYYFYFSAKAGQAASTTIVHLKLNDDHIIGGAFGRSEGQFISLNSIVTLKTGDEISLFLDQGSIVNDPSSQYPSPPLTQFYGLLLF